MAHPVMGWRVRCPIQCVFPRALALVGASGCHLAMAASMELAGREFLSPKAVWEKYAQLFTNVDSEQARFLEFERWGTVYFLSREEILAIVENLFIGNQLEQVFSRFARVALLTSGGSNPIIFASYGDNITPPHQALDDSGSLQDTEDLKQAGQRIVYLTNPHVGHLGIFVSARVARLEHRASWRAWLRLRRPRASMNEDRQPVG